MFGFGPKMSISSKNYHYSLHWEKWCQVEGDDSSPLLSTSEATCAVSKFWAPQCKEYMVVLMRVVQRATKVMSISPVRTG